MSLNLLGFPPVTSVGLAGIGDCISCHTLLSINLISNQVSYNLTALLNLTQKMLLQSLIQENVTIKDLSLCSDKELINDLNKVLNLIGYPTDNETDINHTCELFSLYKKEFELSNPLTLDVKSALALIALSLARTNSFNRPTNGVGELKRNYHFNPGTIKIGVDIVSDTSFPVYAIEDGIVCESINPPNSLPENGALNLSTVQIWHNKFNLDSFYCGLSKTVVNEGEEVTKGQYIGNIDVVIPEMQPTLYFFLSKVGQPINPQLVMRLV